MDLYEIVKFIPNILQYGHMAGTSGEQACCEIGGQEWQNREMESLLEFITDIAETLKKRKYIYYTQEKTKTHSSCKHT